MRMHALSWQATEWGHFQNIARLLRAAASTSSFLGTTSISPPVSPRPSMDRRRSVQPAATFSSSRLPAKLATTSVEPSYAYKISAASPANLDPIATPSPGDSPPLPSCPTKSSPTSSLGTPSLQGITSLSGVESLADAISLPSSTGSPSSSAPTGSSCACSSYATDTDTDTDEDPSFNPDKLPERSQAMRWRRGIDGHGVEKGTGSRAPKEVPASCRWRSEAANRSAQSRSSSSRRVLSARAISG